MRSLHQNSGFNQAFNGKLSQLLRTLYIIGHLMKTFDFDDEQFKGSSQVGVVTHVHISSIRKRHVTRDIVNSTQIDSDARVNVI